MPTIFDAYDLARKRGYLPLRADTRWLAPEPAWLAKLQQHGGFSELETTLGYPIPEVVKDFWKLSDLVRLLDSWRWQDYLEPPEIVYWEAKPNLVVCTHPHSGGVGAVLLDGSDDPALTWGYADDGPIQWREVTMAQHVFMSVQLGPDES